MTVLVIVAIVATVFEMCFKQGKYSEDNYKSPSMMMAKEKFHPETMSAIFIIVLLSVFILANFLVGFNIPVYAVVMMIASVIAILHPRSGLYAIIVLTFVFERFFTLAPIVLGRSEYKLYPLDVILVGIILGIAWQLLRGAVKRSLRSVDLIALAFIGMSFIYFLLSAFVWNADVSLAFSSAKNYGFYSLFYFIVFFLINSREHFMRFGKFVIAGAVAIVPFVLFGIATGHGLWSEYTPLSTDGVRTLAFTHGFYLSLALLLAIIYVIHSKNRFTQMLIFLMPIWVLGIVGSMMRHLWISLGISLVFLYIIFTRVQKIELRKRVKTYGAVLIVALVAMLYVVSLFPHSQMNQTLQSITSVVGNRVVSVANTDDESIMWRSAVWAETFKEYKHNPITGLGFGNRVFIEIGKYRDFIEVRNIHNSFLVLLAQMGIFGVTAIALLVGILAYRIFTARWIGDVENMATQAALSILLLYVVAFLFQPYLEANLLGIFFWINLGILRALYELTYAYENFRN